jgi:hypothetical protein
MDEGEEFDDEDAADDEDDEGERTPGVSGM